MRHTIKANDLSALLTALNALAAVPKALERSPNIGEAIRTGESWVARISKEKWTGKKGLAVASAVVGVGAILYGVKQSLAHGRSEGPIR